jgi:hypothetical protein
MAVSHSLSHLDPTALAVAEVRARQAGVSLEEWLAQLVLSTSDVPLRAPSFYGGGIPHAVSKILPLTEHFAAVGVGRALAASTRSSGTPSKFASDDLIDALDPLTEAASSAMHFVAAFSARVDFAAILLSAAFEDSAVRGFRLSAVKHATRRARSPRSWHDSVIEACIHRSHEVRNALVHRWEPTPRAERLAIDAFVVLSDLTTAGHQLLVLCRQDRIRAFAELAKHLDLATRQFELSADLLTEVDRGQSADRAETGRFAELRASLLQKAGGGLSLTDAAGALGISRQALHKRIKAGTVLGMMDGAELVLPRAQWTELDGRLTLIPGLSDVLKLFATAGGWSALQFLVEPDPNLAIPPITALAEGRQAEVVAAAQAYLSADEE